MLISEVHHLGVRGYSKYHYLMYGKVILLWFFFAALFPNSAIASTMGKDVTENSGGGAIARVLWERGESQEATPVTSGAPSEAITWFLLFTGITASAFAGFIIARSQRRETAPADEYAIIEDIIEGVDD